MDYLLKPVDKIAAGRVHRARPARHPGEAARPSRAGTARRRAPPARTKLLVRAQQPQLHRGCQRRGLRHHRQRPDHPRPATNLEGQSNYRTIEDLQANLDRDTFWRVHRSYLVNINRIKEVVPWFKSSYQLRMDDRKHTEIPVSRVQTKRLRELFKL